MTTSNHPDPAQLAALAAHGGMHRLPDAQVVLLTGPDAATFLNNFCTQAVANLGPGQTTEGFLCNQSGHVLGHVLIHGEPDGVSVTTLGTVPDVPRLAAHLERYHIMEDLTITDLTDTVAAVFVVGGQADDRVHLVTEAEQLAIETNALTPMIAAPFGWEQAGLVRLARQNRDVFLTAYEDRRVAHLDEAGWASIRVDFGLPWPGREIGVKTFPQELGRVARSVSFTKGCYLGQETIARIHLVGRVNRTLRRLVLAGTDDTIPVEGLELTAEGKPVGTVTTGAWSIRAERPAALAYLRRGQDDTGRTLQTDQGLFDVTDLLER